jgi:hypothetical protein
MFKKIIIGILLLTVVGAAGAAFVYQSKAQESEQTVAEPEPILKQQGIQADQQSEPQTGEPVVAAEGLIGEPWQESGTITELDNTGFQFSLQNGESIYIELGPADYWQSQGVDFQAGQQLIVKGTINEATVHASQVTLPDGHTLVLRTETGQPMWSGGIQNRQGQNAGSQDGQHTPDPKAQVDEWITIEGTLSSFQSGNMTVTTTQSEVIAFKTGRPRFLTEQNVNFQVGDEIKVTGFYENGQFTAGEITQLATGLRVMLRDPNGRPLWAGPGNGTGNGGGNGNGGNRNGANRNSAHGNGA